jgi:epoxyqueuosine reductase
MTVEAFILDAARRLGFAAAGIATIGRSNSGDRFEAWLNEGCSAGMRYLARHRDLRSDPDKLAPGARSAIVVAARYPVNPRPGAGFSTYARGRDYHAVLREKLRQLAAELGGRLPLKVTRVCVDSAPLAEREWALRAGIGWRGRQGQIVHPELGACLLLGELLVDAELRPSAPLPDRCGACRRCVEACPTRAIREDGTVDARRCISCLTIEHDGEFPADLREAMGEALFGCDCCTAVCPWNRFGETQAMPELRERSPMPTADQCLRMSEPEFERIFKDSAVHRLGLKRLQRNAANAGKNRLALA